MQFTSTIIVALLLAVSTSTVTAAQKSANLRGGGSNLQEKPFSDPSPSELSSIMNDAANPPLPNIDRSLVEGVWDSCPGLDYKTEHSECVWWDPNHNNCTNTQIVCWSMIHDECYCH